MKALVGKPNVRNGPIRSSPTSGANPITKALHALCQTQIAVNATKSLYFFRIRARGLKASLRDENACPRSGGVLTPLHLTSTELYGWQYRELSPAHSPILGM